MVVFGFSTLTFALCGSVFVFLNRSGVPIGYRRWAFLALVTAFLAMGLGLLAMAIEKRWI